MLSSSSLPYSKYGLRPCLVRFLCLIITCGLSACVESIEDRSVEGTDKLSRAQLRSYLSVLSERAARRGIYQIAPIAGIANAETGLAHCWSDATWACQGPASSSCGGGPVIAGSGDGACWREQGGLGIFQLDGGTYNQTLAREGQRVLTLEGNMDSGISFIIRMVREAKYLGSDRAAVDWINGITVGSSRYFEWIDIVVDRYNGCVRGRCSIFTERWYHYDGKTRAILDEVTRLPSISDQPWIGSLCSQDADCDFSTEDGIGRCMMGATRGFCVTSCEGLCPDRSGFATTFCATASQIDGGAGGVCLAKPHVRNSYCAETASQVVDRYVGRSSARADSQQVCVPLGSPEAPMTTSPTEEELKSDEDTLNDPLDEVTTEEIGNGGVCADPSLPPFQERCDPSEAEQWRCACHMSYRESVSQVCRNGAWVSYRLSPRDCARCQGSYSSSCE